MEAIQIVSGTAVPLRRSDVDTDQIIPSDWLKRVERTGFEQGLFSEWRDDRNFILNDERYNDAVVLIGGPNFGTGSSREHAAWSLLDYGFRAIISSSFADIFQNNSLKNGLITIVVDLETHEWLMEHPATELIVDLENTEIILENGKAVSFPIDSFARYCLLHGVDQLGYILSHESDINAYESQ